MECREDAERISPAIERLLMALIRGRFGDMEPSPLSFTQQIALAHVADEGPLRLRSLARLIGTTAATATRTTDALEAAGLVERNRIRRTAAACSSPPRDSGGRPVVSRTDSSSCCSTGSSGVCRPTSASSS